MPRARCGLSTADPPLAVENRTLQVITPPRHTAEPRSRHKQRATARLVKGRFTPDIGRLAPAVHSLTELLPSRDHRPMLLTHPPCSTHRAVVTRLPAAHYRTGYSTAYTEQ